MAELAKERFDAIVVGSGASGGWACKRLTEAGLKVALVDAGRKLDPSEYGEHRPPFELPYRDRAPEVIRRTRPIQKLFCDEHNYRWFANDLEEPYTTAPGTSFTWVGRVRVTGGRTVVWDLAPYYDLVEDYVGISGAAEDLDVLPDSRFLPPMPVTCAETHLRKRVRETFARTVTIGRTAVLTRPLNGLVPP